MTAPQTVWSPPGAPDKLAAKVRRLVGDRTAFCKLLQVRDKGTGRFVPFVPNAAQRRLWDLLDTRRRVIVVKARQVGVSTAVRAWQFHRAYATTAPETYAVLSFHERSARELRRMDQRWIRGLPEGLRRRLERDTVEDMVFGDTLAGCSSFTTRGAGGTRSFSFSGAHLSEFAFYVDPDEVLAQTTAAVGDGPVCIESTVNAPGDAFHRLIMGAPENGWALFTYWWWEHAAYRDEALPDDFERSEEEDEMAERYGLDDAQLWWRRQQVTTLGLSKFRREYPANIDDAFLARDSGFFDPEKLERIEGIWFDSAERELAPPDEDDRYVMGVDTSGGLGQDYSALMVVSLATMAPVYIERTNTTAPHVWAQRVAQVGFRYGQAMVLAEANNHGHVVLRELERLGYKRLWASREGKPWTTSIKSKLEAYECLREAVDAELIPQLDQHTLSKLKALEVRRVAPEAPVGMHDDMAMACALAYRATQDGARAFRREQMGNYMDARLTEARAKRIRRQVLPWKVAT
jgi:hypothetical protein